MKIEIDGLTESQELALTDLFATWSKLGEQGASRWTALFADGNENFHPKILINDEKVELSEYYLKNKYIGQYFSFLTSADELDIGLFFDSDIYAEIIREEEENNI